MKKASNVLFRLALCTLPAIACSTSPSNAPGPEAGPGPTKTDAEYKADITAGMQTVIGQQLEVLDQAVGDLQNAAPTPTGRGWDEAQDAQALAAMKEAWRRARVAYEHVEGAVAPIFPDIDAAIDARYDDFMSTLASAGGDSYLFDDQGVTGMHAVERVLFLKSTPKAVVEFEKVLPGYEAAAYPATEQEAADFKNKLCARLVKDTKTLVEQWRPAKIDIATAFAGLVALMNEQREKVNKAATGEEESRYAQLTLADIHANLEGTITAYDVFAPWIVAKPDADPRKDGAGRDREIRAGFDALKVAYAVNPGDGIPAPPATWSSQTPAAADLQTPFGQLYSSVKLAVDPNRAGSVVHEMNVAADALGFTRFKAP
jgi:iron uptake system component EfeO